MPTPVTLQSARLAARFADDKKGEGVLLLDVRRMTGLTDFFVLVGATSTAHLRAMEDHLTVSLKAKGLKPLRHEGVRSGIWRVIDYGGFIVHLMDTDAREFYGLERLWVGARRVTWQNSRKDKRKGSAPR